MGSFLVLLDKKLVSGIAATIDVPNLFVEAIFAILGVQGAFAPLVLAYDLACVSSLCDELIFALNDKAVEDICYHDAIFPLVTTLNNLNGGEGIGTQVGGSIVDKRSLRRLGSIIISVLVTIVPLFMGMVDIEEEVISARNPWSSEDVTEREFVSILARRNNMTCT